jgi:hypothetical protein
MRILKDRCQKGMASVILGLSLVVSAATAQEKQVGDVADDFELVNVLTGEPVRLTDFEGSIVFLDFFFYW